MSFQVQPSLPTLLPALRNWFDSELGQELLQRERALLDRVLPGLFGMELVQFSVDSRVKLWESSPVQHCFAIAPQLELGMDEAQLVALSHEVPLTHESMDVVLLHHALDFTPAPHQVLREASRILRPGGHLVVIGFNPLSLWSPRRLCRNRRQTPPWCGHFLSHRRLSDWLKLLELTELKHLSGYYLPPFDNQRWRARCRWLERYERGGVGHYGAFSLVLARKDIAGMTPIRSGWGLRRLINIPVAKPTARGQMRENR
ncbi:class I SAM-dependent methyltransferase [Pontibacter sp. JAM-7]|uniref:class I SAM-dependent methyltransferase n=1 Tax=Pontibacter sp. JAM-7 TaxID=3366581 RepID=UPI003AF862F4